MKKLTSAAGAMAIAISAAPAVAKTATVSGSTTPARAEKTMQVAQTGTVSPNSRATVKMKSEAISRPSPGVRKMEPFVDEKGPSWVNSPKVDRTKMNTITKVKPQTRVIDVFERNKTS